MGYLWSLVEFPCLCHKELRRQGKRNTHSECNTDQRRFGASGNAYAHEVFQPRSCYFILSTQMNDHSWSFMIILSLSLSLHCHLGEFSPSSPSVSSIFPCSDLSSDPVTAPENGMAKKYTGEGWWRLGPTRCSKLLSFWTLPVQIALGWIQWSNLLHGPIFKQSISQNHTETKKKDTHLKTMIAMDDDMKAVSTGSAAQCCTHCCTHCWNIGWETPKGLARASQVMMDRPRKNINEKNPWSLLRLP